MNLRVFVSWSGKESQAVAELLRSWIPNVVQEASVYVSSQDIAKGERWQANVGNNLADHDFGIVVVTPSNLTAPWIQFEAGALSKSVKSRLIPLLCGLDAIDAPSNPLVQFQYALANSDDLLRIAREINGASARPLDEARINASFLKWAPDFFEAYSQLQFSKSKPPKDEQPHTRLGNIEDVLKEMMKQMRDLASRLDNREREDQNRSLDSRKLKIAELLASPVEHTNRLAEMAANNFRVNRLLDQYATRDTLDIQDE